MFACMLYASDCDTWLRNKHVPPGEPERTQSRPRPNVSRTLRNGLTDARNYTAGCELAET